jgi:hypothetical protein
MSVSRDFDVIRNVFDRETKKNHPNNQKKNQFKPNKKINSSRGRICAWAGGFFVHPSTPSKSTIK